MADFYKYQGTGNDFIIFDATKKPFDISPKQIASLCDRNFGIGADGVILVKKSKNAEFFMDFNNSDGSKAEMCGNGIRCVAAFVHDVIGLKDSHVMIETLSGIKEIKANNENFAVKMGKPIFDASEIPIDIPVEEAIDCPIEIDGDVFNITAVSMGNPHAVIFGDESLLDQAKEYGPKIETSRYFPNKTNVEFVSLSGDNAKTVVWERGVGLTLACGTGACAVLAAAEKLGKVKKSLNVVLPGGRLKVEYDVTGAIIMTGPAKQVFKGQVKFG